MPVVGEKLLMLHVTCFRIETEAVKMENAPIGNMIPVPYDKHLSVNFEKVLNITDKNGCFCYHCKLKDGRQVFRQFIIYVIKGKPTLSQATFIRSGLRRGGRLKGLVPSNSSSPLISQIKKVAFDQQRKVDTTIIGVINQYLS